MRFFISGGCKNGKSHYAQRLAEAQRASCLYYIATMKPVDEEDDERIARHIKERAGRGFITVERPADIEGILERCDPGGSFLLDSATALLANEMFLPDGRVNERAAQKIIDGLALVIGSIENLVIVSDYIYSDAAAYSPLAEKYRKSLAAIDRAMARKCDAVLEIVYANVIIHKGKEIYEAML